MNTLDLELIGGDESELTELVSAFVRRERRLPRHEDLLALREHRHRLTETDLDGQG